MHALLKAVPETAALLVVGDVGPAALGRPVRSWLT